MFPLTQRLLSEEVNPALSQLLTYQNKFAKDAWYMGQSDIAGQGIFAGQDYKAGDIIDVAMADGGEDEWGAKIWNLTLPARYCNHQENNNVALEKDGNYFNFVAVKPISQDDELVVNYRDVTRKAGPHSRMQWNGKDIPVSDLEDYVEKVSSSKTIPVKQNKKEKVWYHSCCGKPAGECPGCPGGSQLVEKV